jgi:hypothetical protein
MYNKYVTDVNVGIKLLNLHTKQANNGQTRGLVEHSGLIPDATHSLILS